MLGLDYRQTYTIKVLSAEGFEFNSDLSVRCYFAARDGRELESDGSSSTSSSTS